MPLTQEQREWLALTLTPGVGTNYFVRLLARFETPGAVLRASEVELADVVGPKRAQNIRQYRELTDVAGQEKRLAQYEAQLITMDDPAYPVLLAEVYDPPLVLFCRGALHQADQHAVAIVGTRHPTAYGLRMARQLGYDLAARGITVVSGLAEGVDGAAHEGALEAGGRTIAVLGCGVDVVFPAVHAELMHQITQRGSVVSSFEMGVKPSRGHFPYRNRIISGLSLATVVVEAPPGSGSLITARNAAEQGREVFAVPGQVGQRNSLGPHSLLREGARLVETVDDILTELELPMAARVAPRAKVIAAVPEDDMVPEALVPARAQAPRRAPVASPPRPNITDVEKDVMSVLNPDGSFVDEIALACRIPVSEALSSLTMLELKGLVRQFSGKRFAPR
jgi:DNA processing protein